jgi:hypothetical protein
VDAIHDSATAPAEGIRAGANAGISQASAAAAFHDPSPPAQDTGGAPHSLESEAECVMCLDGAPTHILAPCGHQCICAECVASIKLHTDICPLCRRVVDSVVAKVFR